MIKHLYTIIFNKTYCLIFYGKTKKRNQISSIAFSVFFQKSISSLSLSQPPANTHKSHAPAHPASHASLTH